MVYEYHQDDPTKCTAAKLARLGLARQLRTLKHIPIKAIVLNPAAAQTLRLNDNSLAEKYGIVGLDCSWNQAEQVFDRNIPGENRRLPTLLAGNPTNYGIAGRLSTAEALAATLYLIGYKEQAYQVLAPFRWGNTFLSLNQELLDAYHEGNPEEAAQLENALSRARQG